MAWPALPTLSSGTTFHSTPIREQHKPLVLKTMFGDGYMQETTDSNTADGYTLNVQWNELTQADMVTLTAFLSAGGGGQKFTFQPAPQDASARTWVCQEWNTEQIAHDVWNVTAVFLRRYDAP